MDDGSTQRRTGFAAAWLALFASSGTLVCCALPALLVALGAGAALSSLVSAVPQLVWISENKGAVFTAAGLMLATAGAVQWRVVAVDGAGKPVSESPTRRLRFAK